MLVIYKMQKATFKKDYNNKIITIKKIESIYKVKIDKSWI
jgi:hypothetical protein